MVASNAAALFPSPRVPLVFQGREPAAKEIRRLHWRLGKGENENFEYAMFHLKILWVYMTLPLV